MIPRYRVNIVSGGNRGCSGTSRRESHQAAPGSSSTNEFGKRQAAGPPGLEPVAVALRTGEDMKAMEARVKAEILKKKEEMKQASKREQAINSEVSTIEKAGDLLHALGEANAAHIPQATLDIINQRLTAAHELCMRVRAGTAGQTEGSEMVKSIRKMEVLAKQTIRACSKFAA